jgi:hypothetical protein
VIRTAPEALAFVREHGLVLQSAHAGDTPVLVDFIAGERIRGSWWGHPLGRDIFRVLGAVYASSDVVALRLIAGKVTLAHRRAWPALVALSDQLGHARLAAIDERHTESGRHAVTRVPFPDWVPAEVIAAARHVDLDAARALCRAALDGTNLTRPRRTRRPS